MQVVAILLVCFAAAHAQPMIELVSASSMPMMARVPSMDSAHIRVDRLGGSFAYEVLEGHAYASVSPIVQNVAVPVAVTQEVVQAPMIIANAAPTLTIANAAPTVTIAKQPETIVLQLVSQ